MKQYLRYGFNQADHLLSSTKRVWLAVLIMFLIVYGLTCQRNVSWQDSGKFQLRALEGDWRGDGLALAHPLYMLVASLVARIPLGEFASRLNFLSSIGMAVTLANLAAIGMTLSGKRLIGIAIATMLGVTHVVWWLSTIAEVYTWSVAGLSLELCLLIRLLRDNVTSTTVNRVKLFTAILFVNGLGLSIHNFALLPLPVYLMVGVALVLHRQLPLWSFVVAVMAYLLGAGLFVALFVEKCIRLGDILAAVNDALVGGYGPYVFNTSLMWESLRFNAALASLSFANFLLPLAVIGFMRFHRLNKALAVCLTLITAIEVIFVVRYSVPDQFTFLLPSMLMIAISAAVGLDVLTDASLRWRRLAIIAVFFSIFFPPFLYAASPALLKGIGWQIQRARDLPFRDEMRYWMIPWKFDEQSAYLFARQALEQAAPDGIILADETSLYSLILVQRLEHVSPGVWLPYRGNRLPSYERDRESFFRMIGDRPVFVVSPKPGYAPAGLLEDAEFVRMGVLYQCLFTSNAR